jgi:hypothetical protein
MKFEWDVKKNKTNVIKHGLDFETAAEVFKDPNKLLAFNRIKDGELRLQVIGEIEDVIVVMVVYIHRTTNIRIISARPASLKERSVYYGKND